MNKTQTPKFPLAAELHDLAACLNQMGERPLKLIADKVYKRFNESNWNTPKWSFVQKNGIIEDKKLLANEDDTFQFSIANRHSKQSFHVHKKVFEIYASHSKMGISYIRDGKEETIQVSSGVFIVPPGVTHKIQLHGITFVFQSAVKGSKVHGDKEIRSLKFSSRQTMVLNQEKVVSNI